MTQIDGKTAWTHSVFIIQHLLEFKGAIRFFIVFTVSQHKQNDHRTSAGTCCGSEPVTQRLLNRLLGFLDFGAQLLAQNLFWNRNSPLIEASNTHDLLIIIR